MKRRGMRAFGRARRRSASNGSDADLLARQRAVGGLADEGDPPLRIGRRDGAVAEGLAVGEVVAGAAPGSRAARPARASAGRTGWLAKRNDFEPCADRSRSASATSELALSRLEIIDHQSRGRLGAADDAGNARARMRAGADEIEVRDRVVAIVDAEPGALGQQRLEAEGRAEMGAEIAREILRACSGSMDLDPLARGPASAAPRRCRGCGRR